MQIYYVTICISIHYKNVFLFRLIFKQGILNEFEIPGSVIQSLVHHCLEFVLNFTMA